MLATGSPSSKQLNKYIDAKNLFFKYLKDIHAKLINFQKRHLKLTPNHLFYENQTIVTNITNGRLDESG